MSAVSPLPVVGIFSNWPQAKRAIDALLRAGFSLDQIHLSACNTHGVILRTAPDSSRVAVETPTPEIGARTIAKAAGGAGLGGLVGLGVITGALPVVAPALAAGSIGVVLTNAVAGSAIAGLASALVRWSDPDRDGASDYESEFTSGRIVLTLIAPGREAKARSVMRRFGSVSRKLNLKRADQACSRPITLSPADLTCYRSPARICH